MKTLRRFSLLNLILLSTVFAMAVGLWRLGNEVVPLREEVNRLRREAGHLHIDDPTKLHAIGIETVDRDYWRWRVYIPEGPTFYLHTHSRDLPRSGIPWKWVGDGHRLHPGEQVFHYRIKEVPGEPDRLTSLLRSNTVTHAFGTEIKIRERKAEWINTPYLEHRLESAAGVMPWQVSVAADKPLVLLRLRARKAVLNYDSDGKQVGRAYREIEEPTDGVMIWIDQFKDGASIANQYQVKD